MDIDEGMIVTIEELGLKFVVASVIGDYTIDFDGRRAYARIESMSLVPFRERLEREES